MIYYGETKDKYEHGCDYGYIVRKGLVLEFIEDATLQFEIEKGEYYHATAIDKDGEQYGVIWDITNPEAENEEYTCDWNTYHVYHI